MSSAQQYISKGDYAHSQIEQFVSVKNYMFVRNDDGKYLLLRFTNLADFIVNSMEFTILQLDSTGAVLETTKLHYDNLLFAPSRTYTPRQGIPVNEFCTDFKLQFSRVTSGDYVYRVQGKEITVLYEPKSQTETPADGERTIWSPSVRPLKHGKQALSVLCGICALILLIGLSVYQMYDRYRDAIEEAEEARSSQQSTHGDAIYRPDRK